jgi:hypothetical protein
MSSPTINRILGLVGPAAHTGAHAATTMIAARMLWEKIDSRFMALYPMFANLFTC